MKFKHIALAVSLIVGGLWLASFGVDGLIVLREHFIPPSFEKGSPSVAPSEKFSEN